MSMFTITGQVLNTFEAPARVDRTTGESYDAKPKVQLLGEMPVPGNQTRMELVTLSCEDQSVYDGFKGKTVSVPLGIFAPAKGQVIYFIPKGSVPVEVPQASASQAVKFPPGVASSVSFGSRG